MYTEWVKWRRYFLFPSLSLPPLPIPLWIFCMCISIQWDVCGWSHSFSLKWNTRWTVSALKSASFAFSRSLSFAFVIIHTLHCSRIHDPPGWNLNFQLRIDSIPCDFARNLSFFPLSHFYILWISFPFHFTVQFSMKIIFNDFMLFKQFIFQLLLLFWNRRFLKYGMMTDARKKCEYREGKHTHNNSNSNVRVSLSSVPFIAQPPLFLSPIVYRSVHTHTHVGM